MPDTFVKTVTTTGGAIRPSDVITVGGIPHTISDVRELPGSRKRLQFADGNAYVLARTMPIEVTRTYTPVYGRQGPVSVGQFRQQWATSNHRGYAT